MVNGDQAKLNNQAQKPTIDWKKKGLGWIPDYPDLRDYKLNDEEVQKQGQFRREEITGTIESLTETLINALEVLQRRVESTPDDSKKIDFLIKDLANKVFGDIQFAPVKFCRILRESASEKRSEFSPFEANGISERIHELKTYLYLLFSKIDSDILNSTSFENLNTLSKAVQWLKQGEFDTSTKRLVALLQCTCGIRLDGIAGLETFNALEKLLFEVTQEVQLQILKDNVKECHRSLVSNSWKSCDFKVEPTLVFNLRSLPKVKLASIPTIRLIAVPSLIPAPLFNVILDHIFSQVSTRFFQDFIKFPISRVEDSEQLDKKFLEDLFDDQFLMKNKAGKISPILFEDLSNYNQLSFSGLFKQTSKRFQRLLKSTRKFENESEAKKNRFYQALNKDLIQANLKKDWDINLFSEQEFSRFYKQTSDLEKLRLEKAHKIFQSEFSLLEPLTSVILKIVSPMGVRYRNLEEALVQAFKELDLICESSAPINPTVTRDLVKQAILKVQQNIRAGLELVTGEWLNLQADLFVLKHSARLEEVDQEQSKIQRRLDECKANFEPTLCFYFLVKNFIQPYFQKLLISTTESSKLPEKNYFDQQELLEFVKPISTFQAQISHPEIEDEENSQPTPQFQKNFELFRSESLLVPVNKNLLLIKDLFTLDERTRIYLFLPGVVDLSYWCSPIEDQASLNACTAFAGIGLLEYFAIRSRGRYTEVSPLFLYKATRNLMQVTGDVGGSVRETMRAMNLFGVPPEQYWKYEEENVDAEPPQFCYSFAQNYQALKYFRLDYAGISREILLFQIKAVLAAGFPCIFGFTVYTSAYEDENIAKGYIPYPNVKKDRVAGGHAVMAVGYDDYRLIEWADGSSKSKGALLIRNSWGTYWGEDGYGWLPYDYILQGLTRDWWSLLKSEWFDADSLGVGAGSMGANATIQR